MTISTRGFAIVESLRNAKKDFGDSYPKKYGGAAAIEILRAELSKDGIITSRRDVYIKGFTAEIDLIIPDKTSVPWNDLLYEPGDVIVALEVKKTGSYGEKGRDKIKNDFSLLRKMGIKCAYITFEDRENYRWRPTEKILGSPCFAMAWHKDTDGPLIPTNDTENWEAFVRFLREVIA